MERRQGGQAVVSDFWQRTLATVIGTIIGVIIGNIIWKQI
jgi:uncharacterized membrane protein